MKLQALMLPLFILLFNTNCRLVNKHSNLPVSQNSAQNENNDTAPLAANYQPDTSSVKTRFGVMVSKSGGSNIPPQRQVQVVKALGVNYTRAKIDIDTWNGNSPAYDAYTAGGLKVILNINSAVPRDAIGNHKPVPFPTDMVAYSNALNSILDKYKPEVLAIENEEDNPLYHTGDADDYINQLKTAIDIAHKRGLKITNGGITVKEVCLIVYDDLMQHGKEKEAMDFASKVAPPAFMQRFKNPNNKMIQRQVAFGRKILAAYKTLDLDYVNFHWYEPVFARNGGGNVPLDPTVITYVANYLKKETGKPVMSNEFGVLNPSPELVKDLLEQVRNAGLAYAIFYSADGDGDGKAVALQGADGNLKDNGLAFRNFVQQAR